MPAPERCCSCGARVELVRLRLVDSTADRADVVTHCPPPAQLLVMLAARYEVRPTRAVSPSMMAVLILELFAAHLLDLLAAECPRSRSTIDASSLLSVELTPRS